MYGDVEHAGMEHKSGHSCTSLRLIPEQFPDHEIKSPDRGLRSGLSLFARISAGETVRDGAPVPEAVPGDKGAAGISRRRRRGRAGTRTEKNKIFLLLWLTESHWPVITDRPSRSISAGLRAAAAGSRCRRRRREYTGNLLWTGAEMDRTGTKRQGNRGLNLSEAYAILVSERGQTPAARVFSSAAF